MVLKLFFGIIEEKTVPRVSTGLALKPDYRKTYVGLLSKAGGTSVVAIRGAGKNALFYFPESNFFILFWREKWISFLKFPSANLLFPQR